MPAPPALPLMHGLDRGRRPLVAAVAGRFRPYVVERERRVFALAIALTALTFSLATLSPIATLALGPLIFGVPHVLADVRYLVMRPGHHRRPVLALVPLVACTGALFGMGVRAGLACAIAAALLARARLERRLVVAAIFAGICAAAELAPGFADVAFAHLHNLIGVGFWLAWRRRASRLHWAALGVMIVCALAIVSGATDGIVARTGGMTAPWTGLDADGLGWVLAPTAGPIWSARLLTLYAFMQGVHYVVWLRLVPEEDRPSSTPRSFSQSYRALTSDLGGVVLWAALLTALGLVIYASFALAAARDAYFQLAFLHTHIELGAIALLVCEGTRAIHLERG